jgi:hypothetical protein
MPKALTKLQEAASNNYVDLQRLFPEKLPKHTDVLSDLCLDLSDSQLEIDLYHLALKAPSRASCLKEYPRHQTIAPERDSQINQVDLKTYFEGKPLILTAHNLSSFWAIAVSFQDGPLFQQIKDWLQHQNLALIKQQRPQYLEQWLYLATANRLFEDLIPFLRAYTEEFI